MLVFVFGSNLAGRHGAGAARDAVKYWGAQYGQGVGRQGNSYAIPTKDENIKTLPLSRIKPYVEEFLQYIKTKGKEDTMMKLLESAREKGYKPEGVIVYWTSTRMLQKATFEHSEGKWKDE